MAIQKSFTTKSDIVLASAYHRISRINFVRRSPRPDFIEGEVSIYKDAQARNDGKSPVKVFSFNIRDTYPGTEFSTFFGTSALDTVNQNVISQCYEWMKTKSSLKGIDYTTGVTDV